jgi:hypothetical protein
MGRTCLSVVAAALGLVAPCLGAAQATLSASVTRASGADTAAYPLRTLSPSQAQADVALLRRALELIHPGLYRYTSKSKVDAAFGRLEAEAKVPMTDLDMWRDVALLLAEIHCDHTKPEPPVSLETWRDTHSTHLPFRFQIVEGRMIVVSHAQEVGSPPEGAEVTEINGRPVPRILTTLSRAVAYDGGADQSVAAKLGADGDLMGDDFNEYWPAFYGFPEVWTLRWKRDADTHLSTSRLDPISFSAWRSLPWPGGAYRTEFYNGIRWRMSGKIAYLKIDTFVNYRNPVDATAFLDGFFKQMASAGTERLILDLRENGGGSEDVSVALGRYLMPTDFVWSKPVLLKAIRYGDLSQFMETWGDRQALFEPPLSNYRRTAEGWWERLPKAGDEDDASTLSTPLAADHFHGALTILIGPANGSGATRTIAQFKEKLNADLIGEDAAGSAEGPTAGHIFLMTLPNSGVKVRIPNAWNRTNISHFITGKGVAADQIVVQTLIDFEAGYDQALVEAKAVKSTPPPPLATGLAGDWAGTLDYRDFGDDNRVILPTRMSAKTQGGGTHLDFVYDDGPGKLVKSSEAWDLSEDGRVLTVDGEAYRVIERLGGQAPDDLTLVADGEGEENRVPVKVRLVLARRADLLTLSRLTRRDGEPFLLRHADRLTRVH